MVGERSEEGFPALTLESSALGEIEAIDDAFLASADYAPFALSGGGRRLELRKGECYPFAQVYAPEDLAAVAFEPTSFEIAIAETA